MRQRLLRVAAILCCLSLLPGLTSCAEGWRWLWTREEAERPTVDSSLLHVDTRPETETSPEGETETPRYDFDIDQIHAGVGIEYPGPETSPNSRFCVVIDAAHQSRVNNQPEPIGPGARETQAKASRGEVGGYTGQAEHELNLSVALLLRNELCRRGYSVLMVRETADVNISNRERAELSARVVDDYERTVYIRIQAGSTEDPSLRGASALCPSSESPYTTPAALYDRSQLLAELVLNAYCTETAMRKQETPLRADDSVPVLNWSEVPAAVLELGHLSHETEDTLMRTNDFRDAAAIGMADGLESYFRRVDGLSDDERLPVTIAPTETPKEPDPAPEATETESRTETKTETEEGSTLETNTEQELTPDSGSASEADPEAGSEPLS